MHKSSMGHRQNMPGEIQDVDNELKEIDICDGDICSEAESGVFVNSGALYTDGFAAFHKWASAGHSGINSTSSEKNSEECASWATSTFRGPPTKCVQAPFATTNADRVDTVCYDCNALLDGDEPRASRTSIVDCLLVELYDTYTSYSRRSVDSLDSSTEASSSDAFFGRSNTGSNFLQELQEKHTRRHQMNYLAQKDSDELKWIIQEVKYRIGIQSAKLVRQLRRKDRLYNKLQKNSDIVTACLQAVSQKRTLALRTAVESVDLLRKWVDKEISSKDLHVYQIALVLNLV